MFRTRGISSDCSLFMSSSFEGSNTRQILMENKCCVFLFYFMLIVWRDDCKQQQQRCRECKIVQDTRQTPLDLNIAVCPWRMALQWCFRLLQQGLLMEGKDLKTAKQLFSVQILSERHSGQGGATRPTGWRVKLNKYKKTLRTSCQILRDIHMEISSYFEKVQLIGTSDYLEHNTEEDLSPSATLDAYKAAIRGNSRNRWRIYWMNYKYWETKDMEVNGLYNYKRVLKKI